MQDAFTTLAVFSGIGFIVKIFADSIIRAKLIRHGLVDEKIKFLFANDACSQRLSSLKWGLVLTAIGVALFVRELLPARWSDESTFGLMFIFAGVAFLLYFAIAHSMLKDNREGTNDKV